MANETTTQPPEDQFAQLQRYVEMIQGRQQAYAPPAPVDRSITSLLGEAVGGGTTGLSPAEREDAGRRALLNFGANLSAASGPSTMPRGFGQVFAQGVGGAMQSLAGSEAVGAARLGAQQAYEEKQQELRLAALKEAIPLLKLQQGQNAANLPSSIGTAGAPPAAPEGAYGKGGPAADTKVPEEYLPYYQEASQRTGIPVDVLIAQARQESGFNAGATGKAGEIGLHQIKPTTAADPGFGVRPIDPAALKDPRANINFAADYLKAHLPPGADPTDPAAIRLALKGYNGGGDPNYVANVTRYLPAPAPQKPAAATQPPAPFKVATAGPTVPAPAPGAPAAPPAPGSVAAETAGLVVPPGATPAQPAPSAPSTATAPPAPPQFNYVFHAPPPGVLPGPDLTPDEASVVRDARSSYASSIRAAAGADDPAKARGDAEARLQQTLGNELTIRSGRTKEAADKLATWVADDFKQQEGAFNKVTDDYYEDKKHQRALEVVHATADEARKTAEAALEGGYVTKQREKLDTIREASRSNINDLQMLGALSDAAGAATPIQNITVPGGKTVRDWLVGLGIGTDAQIQKMGAQQAFKAAVNKTITGLRSGMNMGQLSDRDMQFITEMAPDMLQSPETRKNIIAYLEHAQYRSLDYADKLERIYDAGKPKGMSWAEARREAEKQMPEYIERIPAAYNTMSPDKQKSWKQTNLRPGQLIRSPEGLLTRYDPGRPK